jgi:NADH:ubiquinone oxidoreductase subunit 3 (subunit A)
MYCNYKIIYIYICICFFLVLLLFFLSFFLAPRLYEEEKLSIYECGFSPYGDSRLRFEVKFYFIAILFLIFDLELTFLFPWIVNFMYGNFISTFLMVFFLIILFIGYIYELSTQLFVWTDE